MFGRDVIHAIRQHAVAAYPEEACGLVVADSYIRCRNVHEKPREHFRMAAEDYAAALTLGPIQAVVHSHPDGPDCPNADDIRYQLAAELPCGIVCSDGQNATEPFWFGDQAPMPPLIGRGFRHGVTDCLSLIRDWYRLERGITIPEFPRDWEWWLQEGDANPHFYRDCFDAAGFVEISGPPEPGDVWRVSIRSATPNHAGIYLGNNLGLHHLAGRLASDPKRLSKREPLGRYANMIQEHRWLRYRA